MKKQGVQKLLQHIFRGPVFQTIETRGRHADVHIDEHIGTRTANDKWHSTRVECRLSLAVCLLQRT